MFFLNGYCDNQTMGYCDKSHIVTVLTIMDQKYCKMFGYSIVTNRIL